MDEQTSPYPGLSPYTDRESDLFVGREQDIDYLVANISTRRLTIVYGDSGVGKTSLLQAGVAPSLARHERSVAVVFRDWLPVDYRNALRRAVTDALAAKSRPIPDKPEFIDFLVAAANSTDIFLIFDQFEDYFFTRGERGWLEEAVPDFLHNPDLGVNFVLSVRADAMYLLDPLQDHIPHLFANSIQVEPLSREDARRAITEPLDRYSAKYASLAGQKLKHPPIEPGLADLIVNEISDESSGRPVQAAFLQIILSRLWEEEARARIIQLRRKTLQETLRGVRNIALDYVSAGISAAADSISKTHSKALQDDVTGVCSFLFRRLVTSSGRSIPHTAEELKADVPLRIGDLVPEVLDVLQRRRVLKPITSGAGPPMFAMMHDVLGEAVIRWQAGHEQKTQVRQEIRKTEASVKTYSTRFRSAVAVLVLLLIAAYFFGERLANEGERQRAEALRTELAQAASQITTQTSEITARDVEIGNLKRQLPAPTAAPSQLGPKTRTRSPRMLKSIDILVGLTLVMLVASMAVTVVTQGVASLLQSRGKHLRDGIAELLRKIDSDLPADMTREVATAVLTHPLIRGPRGLGTVIHREELIGILLELASGGQLHSETAGRLTSALKVNGIDDPSKSLRQIRTAALQIERKAPELANHLRYELAILDTAASDFVAKVHAWFDSTMDRVSERFTHSTRLITFIAAASLAVLLQLDTVGLVNRLAMDDALREALSVQAQAIAKTQADLKIPDSDASQQYARALEHTGIVTLPHDFRQWVANWQTVNPLGICLSALLVTLGAPFWYDILKRVVNLRPVIAAKDDQERSERQRSTQQVLPKELQRRNRSGDNSEDENDG